MKKYLFLASLSALVLAGCSNNEYEFGSDAGSKLSVSASIHEATTRAHDTSWDANDAIGVSDTDQNINVKYTTTSGDGVFSSTDGIYLLGDESHSFTAYYPYDENVTAENKVITFTEPKDFMYATASATRQSPTANFVFAHKMSELSFTIKDATSATTAAKSRSTDETSTSTITLKNVILGGTFNAATGEVVAGTNKGDLKVDFTVGEKSSFILPPQTFDSGITISVTHDGKTYGGTISLDKSLEGTDIQYTLTINKQNEGKALTISSKTITGWTAVEKGNQDLEEKEAENVLEIGDFLLSDGSVVDKAYDLTTLTNTGKKVVGVVYYVGNAQPSSLYSKSYNESQDILKAESPNATHGLAIAINNANDGAAARLFSAIFNYSSDWYKVDGSANSYISTTLDITSPDTVMLGYNNTAVIEKVGETYGENSTSTGAANFLNILSSFRTANSVSNCSKWYLPSYGELKKIQDNFDDVYASIKNAGGTLEQFSELSSSSFYWSSNLRASKNAWVSLLNAEVEETKLYINRTSTQNLGYFRFAVAF